MTHLPARKKLCLKPGSNRLPSDLIDLVAQRGFVAGMPPSGPK
ncbi:hypothetical protein ACWCQZ_26445 [Streptomyces sp. NPDC002285]